MQLPRLKDYPDVKSYLYDLDAYLAINEMSEKNRLTNISEEDAEELVRQGKAQKVSSGGCEQEEELKKISL